MAAKRGRRAYHDVELLAPICEFAGEHGRPPTSVEYDEYAAPSRSTVADRFGTYRDAVDAAGYDPDVLPNARATAYDDDTLLRILRRRADELGHPPRLCDITSEEGLPSPWPYRNRWGSWTAALAAAGLDPDARPKGTEKQTYSDAELLDWLDAFVREFGVVPVRNDLVGWPGPAAGTYQRRFGSVAAAVEEAGYEPRGGSDV